MEGRVNLTGKNKHRFLGARISRFGLKIMRHPTTPSD
jgi:hypothetical protein